MYLILHHLLRWTYLLLPPAMLGIAVLQVRRGTRADAVAVFLLSCASAIFISAGVTAASAALFGGRLHPGQVGATWYFVIGVLCLLKVLRSGLASVIFRLMRVPRNRNGTVLHRGSVRGSLAQLVQNILLCAIGLPLVVGALASWRVRTYSANDPDRALAWNYSEVTFPATDGSHVAGWWIPAEPMPDGLSAVRADMWGKRTILYCQGLGEDRSNQMGLIWLFASDGYNVLAIDLRGQGESGGQWGSFGDLERHDVLGAVRWIKTNHHDGADRIFGMGAGTGGAALIAAATDSSTDGLEWGQQLDALAVASTYADFGELITDTVNSRLPRPLAWMTRRMVVPMASAHAGSDLMHFAPAKLVEKLWPRPILVIHGRLDWVVPFGQGWDLFHAASQPKQSLWLGGDHNSVLHSPNTARTIRDFFFNAKPLPII